MEISTNFQSGDKTNTNFSMVEFHNIDQIKELVKNDWTPSVCIGGRTLEHFQYTQFLFGDVDNDSEDVSTHCSIDRFHEIFKGKEYYIITSRNHRKAKSKQSQGHKWTSPATDRFHVLFPISEDCYDMDWINKGLDELCSTYKFFDSSAKGATRFYFGCESEVYHVPGEKWLYIPREEVEQNYELPNKNIDNDLADTLDSRIIDRIVNAYNSGVFKGYGDWIRCGQALKASGFTIDDFRKITDSNVSERMIVSKWDGFKPSKIGKGTLIEYARRSDPEFLKPGSIKNSLYKPSFVSPSVSGGNGNGNIPPINPGLQTGGTGGTNPPKDARLDFYTKMDVDDFPDFTSKWIVDHESAQTPKPLIKIKLPSPTLRNFEVMLEKYGIDVKYNLMAHRPEITAPGINGEGNTQNASYGVVTSLLKLNKLDCLNVLDPFISTLTNKNKYHPVKDWINEGSEKWDGKDRFIELCNSIETAKDFDRDKFVLYFRKWLLSAYACLFCENYRGRGVLVFQGKQYQGKSALFKLLMKKGEEREWFTEGLTLDPKNKDSISLAISHWISELGELEGTFKRSDISSLKAFLTKETDIIRMPYDKREETYPRRSVFCASVNDALFLADDTGSSRFWVVPIEFIYLDKLSDFNAKQLWLQVKEWYKLGEKWWMSQEEDEELQLTNKAFNEKDPFEDKIVSMYKMEMISYPDNMLRFLSLSDICDEIGIKIISKATTNGVARTLRKMAFRFKHTKFGNGYLMPNLYTSGEKDSNQIIHLMPELSKAENDAV